MDDIWNFIQAKLIFTGELNDFDSLYEEENLNKIKEILNDIQSLPDFVKREIKIDTTF